VWHAPTTTQAERKQLLRGLIKEVTVTTCPMTIPVAVRWQTTTCPVLEVSRPPRAAARRTAPTVVERIRTLAPPLPDRQLAIPLNRDEAQVGSGVPSPRRQWPGSGRPRAYCRAALRPLEPVRPANEARAATRRGRPRSSCMWT
jgi:hypothetical protein